MKLIDQTLTVLSDLFNRDAFLNAETAGRLCYGSKLHDNREKTVKFVTALAHSRHFGVLEHGSVYFKYIGNPDDLTTMTWYPLIKTYDDDEDQPVCTFMKYSDDGELYIYTNLSDLYKFAKDLYDRLANPKGSFKAVELSLFIPDLNDPLKKYSILINTERIQTQSITRYRRESSYCQESQRYYDYNEVEFIRPHWLSNTLHYAIMEDVRPSVQLFTEEGHQVQNPRASTFLLGCYQSEQNYKLRRKLGLPPEDARGAFTNEVASSIIVTKTRRAWQYLHNQRCNDSTGKAHPQIKLLFDMLPSILHYEY